MTVDLDSLVQRATKLVEGRPERVLLGITGAPGAGKSTVADGLVAALGAAAVVVPMDGFHLADEVLLRLGRRERKGAPDTFDVDGFAALLQRLRGATTTVYAPEFRREWEAAVAGAIEVGPEVRLVVTEGNNLLTWPAVRDLLDEVWYLDPPADVRQRRLIDRRVGLGADEDEARRWALGSDEANAHLVARSRDLADLVVPG